MLSSSACSDLNRAFNHSVGVSSLETERDYSDVQVIRLISNSKFPVFLAYSRQANEYLVMKSYPFHNGEINPSYLHECRFLNLNHPNIVSMVFSVDATQALYKGKMVDLSYILMELAFCDFTDMLELNDFAKDVKLGRTYFLQLIEGLEYLHENGISHLDIKLENLLLGRDYKLKLSDFDLSYVKGDRKFRGKGTIQFRAPEFFSSEHFDPSKADIYSAGIILFAFTCGYLPYDEGGPINGHDLQRLMFEEPEAFWEVHSTFKSEKVTLSKPFKDLFMSMVKKDPKARISLKEIKKSKWCQGPVYNQEELSLLKKKDHLVKK